MIVMHTIPLGNCMHDRLEITSDVHFIAQLNCRIAHGVKRHCRIDLSNRHLIHVMVYFDAVNTSMNPEGHIIMTVVTV